ncbi:DNA primase [Criibacterium bergeronii]|uniref:DNA primase n=1 Tax=Criibacterium bergeronii TaxID=1871336 RepID=A0A371IJ24_9FIRM|nr:DNA primase [Criibacterium bergeronii]RDY20477.1 DNA primase [Criibacterium bergeronii]
MNGSNRIDQTFIDNLLEQVSIVGLIGQYVNLKKSGDSYSGLCPFHHEKTPSFMVNEKKKIFKCFGCNEAGNAISFLMKRENLTFIEALKRLCEYAHIDMPEQRELTQDEIRKYNERNRQIELHTELARLYFNNLANNMDNSKKYLLSRGVNEKAIRKFGLGYEKGDGSSVKYLLDKGFTQKELLDSKIFREKNDRVYSIFFRRVMYPIFDRRGKVIAFGGRTLDKDGQPKYLNSPENIIFFKKNQLYGLNYAIKDNADNIILVEGYMDVISLVQNGMFGAVASLGTSLTKEQAKILKFPNKKVYLCYDSDAAGIKATIRAIDILKAEEINPYIISMADCKDPDEFFQKHTIQEFKQNIRDAKTPLAFKIDILRKSYDLKIYTQKQEFIKRAAALLKIEKDPLEKEYQTKRLASSTDTSVETITQLAYGYYSKNRYNSYNNIQIKKPSTRPVVKKTTNEERLKKILQKEETFAYYIKDILSEQCLQDEELKKILTRNYEQTTAPSEQQLQDITKIAIQCKIDYINRKIESNKKSLNSEQQLDILEALFKENINLVKQREDLNNKIRGMM